MCPTQESYYDRHVCVKPCLIQPVFRPLKCFIDENATGGNILSAVCVHAIQSVQSDLYKLIHGHSYTTTKLTVNVIQCKRSRR